MKHMAAIAAFVISATLAANGAEKVQPSPRGGRLLEKTNPRAEFFVEKDRTVTIAFYDEKNKPIPAAEQSVTVVAMTKERQTVEFEKKGSLLVSKNKLPEGDPYPVIVLFKPSAEAKPLNFRFKLDLSVCGGCKLGEYACACHE